MTEVTREKLKALAAPGSGPLRSVGGASRAADSISSADWGEVRVEDIDQTEARHA